MEENRIKELKERKAAIQKLRETLSWDEAQIDAELRELESKTVVQRSSTVKLNDEEDMSIKSYMKTSSRADMSGEKYEVKLAALLFAGILKKSELHHLASNLQVAHPFDDIVLKRGCQSVFIQLKHTRNKRTLYDYEFVQPTSKFCILNFYQSYLHMKEQWLKEEDLKSFGNIKDVAFVLFTNMKYKSAVSNVNTNFLDFLTVGQPFFQVSEVSHPELFDVFENFLHYKHILNSDESSEDQLVNIFHKFNPKATYDKKGLSDLNSQLKCIEDMSGYKEFLSQLYFFVEQPSETGLDHFIKQELESIFGESTMFDKFLSGIEMWWQKSDKFLTWKIPFFQDIIQLHVEYISNPSRLGVMFSQTELNKMRRFSTYGRVWNIKTQCSTITSLKVQQALEAKFIIGLNTLKRHIHNVLALWRLGSQFNELVVVAFERNEISNIDKELLLRLIDVMEALPQKKLIIIFSRLDNITFTNLETAVPNLWTVQVDYHDKFNLSQLDDESQKKVLECEIKFQGFPSNVQSLGTLRALKTALTGNDIVNLFSQEENVKIGKHLCKINDCYIPRKLVRTEHVCSEVLSQEDGDHIFAISGLKLKKLQKLLPADEMVREFNESKHDSCHCFVITDQKHFQKLCTLYNEKSIHWLHAKGNKFVWKSSKGDITGIIKNLNADNPTCYDRFEEVMKIHHHKISLIVAEPGMGKTTEVSHLAFEIKKSDPTTWVVMVNLNDHTDYLSQGEPNAIDLLMKAGEFNSSFQKTLFKHQIDSCGKVVILFDGFDEISPEYSKKVLSILKDLSTKCLLHIWVTSRPVMRNRLEQELSTLSFSFSPFTEDDQKTFLQKRWEVSETNIFDISVFITELLKLAEISLNDRTKEFTGNPLHLRMLADVYQSNARKYRETGEHGLPPKLNLLELYENFINQKFAERCRRNKDNSSIVGVLDDRMVLKEKLQKSHMSCALVALLQYDELKRLPHSEIILKENHEFIEKFIMGRNKTGIVVEVNNNNTAVFVHRTFAEFFISKWFSENLDICGDYVERFFFSKSNLVRNFFDFTLAKESKLHTAVLNHDRDEVESLLRNKKVNINSKDQGGRTALHLAVTNQWDTGNSSATKEILLLLLDHGANPNIEDEVLHCSPLKLSEVLGTWSIIVLILQKQAERKKLDARQLCRDPNYLENVLKESCKEGYVELIACLLEDAVVVNFRFCLSQMKKSSETTMLHVAARYNQLKLMKFLVDRGADIQAKDGSWLQRTPLMLAATEGHLEAVAYLVSQNCCKKNINCSDRRGRPAILLAAHKGKNEVIKVLAEHGADLYVFDKDTRNNMLHYAVMFGNVNSVVQLHGIESIINEVNKRELSPVMLAATRGDWEAIKVLHEHGADITTCDRLGNTVLHYAALFDELNAIDYCVTNGIDVDSRNQRQETPLLCAFQKNSVYSISKLYDLDANIYARDIKGNNSLHYAALNNHNNHSMITKLLLDAKLNLNLQVNSVNKNFETPLFCAAQSGKVEMIDVLHKAGANLDIQNSKGHTAMHKAAELGNVPVMEKLIALGADLTVKNCFGDTAMDTAKKVLSPVNFNRLRQIEILYLCFTKRLLYLTSGGQVPEREDF